MESQLYKRRKTSFTAFVVFAQYYVQGAPTNTDSVFSAMTATEQKEEELEEEEGKSQKEGMLRGKERVVEVTIV